MRFRSICRLLAGTATVIVGAASPAAAVVELSWEVAVRVEWAPAAGQVAAYKVYKQPTSGKRKLYAVRSRNTRFSVVTGQRGEEFSVVIEAVGPGGFVGPASNPSEVMRFVDPDAPPSDPPPNDPPPNDPPPNDPPPNDPPPNDPPPNDPPPNDPPPNDPPPDDPPPNDPPRSATVPLDFDGDGRGDLLLDSDGSLSLGYADPGGLQLVAAGVSLTADQQVVGNADYDGNGYADIAIRNAADHLDVYFRDAAGVSAVEAFSGASGRVAGSADFDGDGAADLLLHAADGSLIAWPRLYDSSNETALLLGAASGSAEVLGVVDRDGDGDGDLLVAANQTLFVFETEGGSVVSQSVLGEWLDGDRLEELCDVTGDGAADLIVVRDEELLVLRSDGQESRAVSVETLHADSQFLGAADFANGSGCEVLAVDSESDQMVLIHFDGLQAVAAEGIGEPADSPLSVGVGAAAPGTEPR